MGQEIATSRFTNQDFAEFERRLREETALFARMFRDSEFSEDHGVGGCEIEAWLVDADFNPAPINRDFLEKFGDPIVGSELASFNIELNCTPQSLRGRALTLLREDIENTWRRCNETVKEFDARIMLIGILPTARNEDVVPENMSNMKRYRALNDQVMKQRKGRPVEIDIRGPDHLRLRHTGVMLESVTTALQIQFQVGLSRAVRFYNSSLAVSAPFLAVSTNSPFIFGKDLWAETRIPVFEQSLAENHQTQNSFCGPSRVDFGCGYARESLSELFQENLDFFRVMLPVVFGDPPHRFSHLRLHNGTIWRWNRPLIGFGEDGGCHLRIENRVAPSGPTIIDIVANAAFFFGLVQAYAFVQPPLEAVLPFRTARDNFYACARDGISAEIRWLDNAVHPVGKLVLDELVPAAAKGLVDLGIDRKDIDFYLGIIGKRVESGQTGSVWMRRWRAKHKGGFGELCCRYIERQESGLPVHEWDI